MYLLIKAAVERCIKKAAAAAVTNYMKHAHFENSKE
jgi:hypothetical protein